MTPADALVAAGIVVHDARVAPRPGAFEPLAVTWHHTGTPNPPKPGTPASLRVCQKGRADLPGPLCQWLVDADGGWWWITEFKANHAGKGSRDVLNWLIKQGPRPDDPPPPVSDNYDAGNRFLVGVEVEGTGHWSPKVHDSMLRGTRVLLKFYGLPKDNLIAHREHTRRKPDPAGIDMAAARQWLRTPPNPDPQPEEDLMHKIWKPVGDGQPHVGGEYIELGDTFVILSADDKQQLANSEAGGDTGKLHVQEAEPGLWKRITQSYTKVVT